MSFTEFDGELDKAPAQGTFTEFDGELDKPDPKRELPAGVKPSEGRGTGLGAADKPRSLADEQGPSKALADIKGTKRAVDQERAEMPQFFNRGGPLADDNAMRRVAQETGQVGTPGYSQVDPATQPPRIPKQAPQELRSNENTIYPTGGVVEAVKAAPGIAARGLAESALTVGKVLADYGVTLPGGPSSREFGDMAAKFEKGNRRATMALSDKNLADMGPLLNSVVPSARTVGEGLSEVGRQVALNLVLPGGIIVDAGFKGVKEAQMAGLSPGAALLIGVLKAGTEGVPEHFSAKFALKEGAAINVGGMLKDPKIALEATKRFGAAMGVELGSEQASAVSSWLVDRLAQDPTATLDRLGTDMTDAIKSTLVQAPGMMAAGKIGAGAAGLARKITSYDIAAQRGFNVNPPYETDPPDTQRKKTIGIFNAAVAQYGIDPDAAKRATEAANSMPAEMVGPFLARMTQALQKRQMVGKPVDPHALDTLTAGPIEDPKVLEAAAKAAETATTDDKPAETVVPRETAAEEDLTGLSEPAKPSVIDKVATEGATHPSNTIAEPTEAQKQAENYKVGHDNETIPGERLSIENGAGSTRKGTSPEGKAWQTDMKDHYGRILGTVGMDSTPDKPQHVDFFAKAGTPAAHKGPVFIVDQVDPKTGKPDEHKVMFGYDSLEEARSAYLAHYEKGWKGLGAITETTLDDFKTWAHSDATSRPYGPAQPDVQQTAAPAAESGAGGGNQPAGSGGTVGRNPAVPRGPAANAPAAPVASGAAAQPVSDGPAPARVIARAGRMPNSAKPIELRPAGTDGKMLSAWHDGYELVDFDSGNPVQIPADATDAQAFEAVKASGAFGKSTKFFDAPKADAAAPTPPAAPIAHPDALPKLRERLSGGGNAFIDSDTSGGVTDYFAKGLGSVDSKWRVPLSLTTEEKKAAKRAEQDAELAETAAEKAEAKQALTEALAPAARRAAGLEAAAPVPITPPADSGVKAPLVKSDKAEIRPYRKPDGSVGYEAVPIMEAAPAPAPAEADEWTTAQEKELQDLLGHAGAVGFKKQPDGMVRVTVVQGKKDAQFKWTVGLTENEARRNLLAMLKPAAVDKPAESPVDKPAETQEQVPAKAELPIPAPAFAEALASVPDVFDAPKETVRIEAQAKKAGTISQDAAKAKIEEWRAHALAQGKTRQNAGRVVLSLFDTSGEWSAPWHEAGYEVHRFDIQDGVDINDFSVEYLTDTLGLTDVYAIIAAPPCTDFSSSGAHAWQKKDADGRTAASIKLVEQTLNTVELFKPAIWAMENPTGRLGSVGKDGAGLVKGLPKPRMTFQPSNFGDPYTKRTLLWGDFETGLPLAPVEPTEGSKMTEKLSGSDKFGRSLTPEGFAYSFFMANNAIDLGAAAELAREFRGVDRALLQQALDAGMTAQQAKNAIEDAFYDGDIEGANEALKAAMPKPKPPAPPTVPKVAQLSDSEAFSGDYAAFEGKTVEQSVSISDTGGTATLRIDAAKAMRALDARLKVLTELKGCIGRAA